MFLTGDKKAEPKLGIDLQGGTRVTLTARTPDGSPPSRESLDQAKTIIENRVNGLGVSGSEVIIDGSNLVITVPGDEGSEARNLGQTARLYIRPVIHVMPAAGAAAAAHRRSCGRTTRGSAGCTAGAPPGCPRSLRWSRARRWPRQEAPDSHPRAPTRGSRAAAAPLSFRAPGPARTGAATGTAGAEPAAGEPSPPREHRHLPGAPGAPPAGEAPLAQRIADEKELRQSTDQQIQILALQFQATRCGEDDVLAGNDDPNLPLVTCSQDGKEVYLLDKSIISGEQIENASSGLDQQRASTSSICSSRAMPPRSGPTSPPPTSAPRPRSRWTRRWSAHRRCGSPSRAEHRDHRTVQRSTARDWPTS